LELDYTASAIDICISHSKKGTFDENGILEQLVQDIFESAYADPG
jgi:hypothetical protein